MSGPGPAQTHTRPFGTTAARHAHRVTIGFFSLPGSDRTMSMMLLDQETKDALQQLYGETIEAMELAKKSPDLDDLAATFAVALLKLGLATGFIEQKYPGFAKDVEEKRQRVIAALTQAQTAKH